MDRVYPRKKKCSVCKKYKSYSEYYPYSGRSKDGYRSSCKECGVKENRRWQEKNKLADPVFIAERLCIRCEKILPREAFGFSKSSKYHLKTICRKCTTKDHAIWMRKTTSKPKSREYRLKRVYGITQVDFETMLIRQNKLCANCAEVLENKSMGKSICIDHNHTTGRVRGILCHKCNSMSGAIERPGFLKEVMQYFAKYDPELCRDLLLELLDDISWIDSILAVVV